MENHSDYVNHAIAKYKAAGWTVIKTGSVNDFIANCDSKLHFVKVYGESELDSPTFHGIARNDFVQNAISNGARPIYASVKKVKKWKVELTDKNENCTVQLRKKKEAGKEGKKEKKKEAEKEKKKVINS